MIPDNDFVTCLEKAENHIGSHSTETDHSDTHGSVFLGWGWELCDLHIPGKAPVKHALTGFPILLD